MNLNYLLGSVERVESLDASAAATHALPADSSTAVASPEPYAGPGWATRCTLC